MSGDRRLVLYLDAPTLSRFEADDHPFLQRLATVLRHRDWHVTAEESTPEARQAAPDRPGHALFHMEEPTHERALTCRRAYIGAFWRIEATARRWQWPVAQARFDAGAIDADTARAFARGWRKRLFGNPIAPARGDTVLIALQGRLSQQRGFQARSPLDMVAETLALLPDRPALITLHPRDQAPPAERQALSQMAEAHGNCRIQNGGSDAALMTAGMVVTQNSAVAVTGFLLHRPALIFAETDFHHIAGSVPQDGLRRALEKATGRLPAFDRYLFWFLRDQAINGFSDQTEHQIIANLTRHGWPV